MEKEAADGFALLEDKTELIHLIDKLLSDLLKETKGVDRTPSPFDCKEVPGISILEYLKRTNWWIKVFASMRIVRRVFSWRPSST